MSEERCYFCGEDNDKALDQHHSIPKALNPPEEVQSEYTLCSNCHRKLHHDFVNPVVRYLNDGNLSVDIDGDDTDYRRKVMEKVAECSSTKTEKGNLGAEVGAITAMANTEELSETRVSSIISELLEEGHLGKEEGDGFASFSRPLIVAEKCLDCRGNIRIIEVECPPPPGAVKKEGLCPRCLSVYGSRKINDEVEEIVKTDNDRDKVLKMIDVYNNYSVQNVPARLVEEAADNLGILDDVDIQSILNELVEEGLIRKVEGLYTKKRI